MFPWSSISPDSVLKSEGMLPGKSVCGGREGTLTMGMLTSLSQECRWRGRSQFLGAWASPTGSDHIWVDRFSLKLSF